MNNSDYNDLLEIVPEVTGKENSTPKTIIKVIGVGGGGCNAVKHMYNMGIKDVDFIICNTDKQALESNPIPVKIQLGNEGLGAGANPEVARQAAIDSEEEIKAAMEGAKMVFVTAGMGGGTGTGASPIVASIAKEMGILTVGIVTFPFDFEQDEKFATAKLGINELHENVDALLVIKNQSLAAYYPDLKLSNAFAKADDILLIAAKSIAELITLESIINIDFRDVDTILRNSGTAIIGSGMAKGENRAFEAVSQAIESPLLDNKNIYGAEKMLLFIAYGSENEITVAELTTITKELEEKTNGMRKKFIWGHGIDESLGENVRVTIIATELHNQAPEMPIKKVGITGETIPDKKEQQQENQPENNQENFISEPTNSHSQETSRRNVSNDELRNYNEQEMNDFLDKPAFLRDKIQQNRANEISDYTIDSNGVECQPSYLKHVVD